MKYNETTLNSHWSLKKLNELGEFKRGKSKHRPRNDRRLFENGSIPLIQTGDIKAANLYINEAYEFYNEFGLSQSKLWDEGTLCITIAANIAETAILRKKMCFPDSVVGFIPYEGESNTYFVHYLFTFIRQRIQNSIQGSIQDNINIDYLEKLELRIPDLPTQQKIAAVLSALDDKIELNNKINAELEAMAKTLYDYWFIQFEFPNAEGKPYKSSGGSMEYNHILKREIPKGWEVKKIGELLKKNDSNLKLSAKEYASKGKFPVIDQSTDFIAGFTDCEDYKISINKNDPAIIFGDHTRILKLINFDFVRGADGTQVLFTNSDKMPQYLFYHSLLKIDLSNYGYARHFKFLKDKFIIVPDEDLANRFNKVVKSIFDKVLSNQLQNQELAELRDWLLPMLMNGQVKVDEVEDGVLRMVAEPREAYLKTKGESKENRFRLWLGNQAIAARGDINEVVLKEIFDAMDEEDQ
jgi:type I restriction enzyme S subunit